jgi:hypothetical protein
MRIAIASVGQSNIEIAAGAIADIMYKFIGTSMVIFKGVFSILGF